MWCALPLFPFTGWRARFPFPSRKKRVSFLGFLFSLSWRSCLPRWLLPPPSSHCASTSLPSFFHRWQPVFFPPTLIISYLLVPPAPTFSLLSVHHSAQGPPPPARKHSHLPLPLLFSCIAFITMCPLSNPSSPNNPNSITPPVRVHPTTAQALVARQPALFCLILLQPDR